jgi:3-oxoacyl-[acyl-carrier protein] reductase
VAGEAGAGSEPQGPGDAFALKGRVALVTGAGSGIGRASARVLAAAGAAVVCADVNRDTAEGTAAAIEDAGWSGRATAVDVTRRGQVAEVVRSTVSELGHLDVMCNIAGVINSAPLMDTTEADLDAVLAVNLKGVLFGCQEAGAVMAGQGSGSIVNMASAAVDEVGPDLVGYSVSKAGVVQVTRAFARALGPRGVRVNAVAPGYVETNMTGRHYRNPDGAIDEARREATLAPIRARSPLGAIGTPEDIAYAVLYLASDGARFVTGQILRPNGGVAMPW